MKLYRVLLLIGIIGVISCTASSAPKKGKKEKTKFVLIETPYGNMKVKLYNETPLHRDNFLKLAKEGFYDSLLFHRVINEFMIQGGDPQSKGAEPGKRLGNGGPGYKIDAEIVPGLIHKKGALAAARLGDNANPEKQSSGSQFYIIHGKKISKEQLAMMEEKRNASKKQKFFYDYIKMPENGKAKAKLDSLNRARDFEKLNAEIQSILTALEPQMDSLGLFHFTDEQKEIYSTIGGSPHLDNEYTIFGEVVEGLNVVDSIAAVKTARGDRPLTDVMMKIKVVRK